jgi:hypothetical protein
LAKAFLYCPALYGYERAIADALTQRGYLVDCFFPDEYQAFRLKLVEKFALRLARYSRLDLLKEWVNRWVFSKHQAQLQARVQGTYELLLVVKGYGLSKAGLRAFPATKKILYQWDRVKKFPSVTPIYSTFDSVFTFSQEDAKLGFGRHLENFPLAFDDQGVQPERRAFFLGEYSAYRLTVLQRLADHCDALGLIPDFTLIDFSTVPAEGTATVSVLPAPLPREEYTRRCLRGAVHLDICRYGENEPTQRYQEARALNRCLVSDHDRGDYSVNAFLALSSLEPLGLETRIASSSARAFDVHAWLEELLA